MPQRPNRRRWVAIHRFVARHDATQTDEFLPHPNCNRPVDHGDHKVGVKERHVQINKVGHIPKMM